MQHVDLDHDTSYLIDLLLRYRDAEAFIWWKHFVVIGHEGLYSLKKIYKSDITSDWYNGYIFVMEAEEQIEGEPQEIELREKDFCDAYRLRSGIPLGL